jgi:hypothetical protein
MRSYKLDKEAAIELVNKFSRSGYLSAKDMSHMNEIGVYNFREMVKCCQKVLYFKNEVNKDELEYIIQMDIEDFYPLEFKSFDFVFSIYAIYSDYNRNRQMSKVELTEDMTLKDILVKSLDNISNSLVPRHYYTHKNIKTYTQYYKNLTGFEPHGEIRLHFHRIDNNYSIDNLSKDVYNNISCFYSMGEVGWQGLGDRVTMSIYF